MRKIMQALGIFLVSMLVIPSCNPTFDASVEDLDLAISTYDKTQNFGQLSTFHLEDTVIYISDDKVTIQREDNSTEQQILDLVRQNLLDIGWQEVTDTAADGTIDSDVSILVSVLKADLNFYYTYWWDWWYWYPWDYWYPGYPGYPVYPVYPTYPSYGYTVGSLMIEMINMDDVILPPVEGDPSLKIPVVWTGIVNGILSGSKENIQNRLNKQITQVFYQSDYLHKGTIDK